MCKLSNQNNDRVWTNKFLNFKQSVLEIRSVKKMKNQILKFILTIVCISLIGCNKDYSYHPGEPYYYKSDIVNYQPFQPSDEITKEEAEQLYRDGYAYYIAYFNSDGNPTIIEKHYHGKIDRKSELFYENGKLFKTITTDSEGKQKINYYNE